jgi:hypothetical protein
LLSIKIGGKLSDLCKFLDGRLTVWTTERSFCRNFGQNPKNQSKSRIFDQAGAILLFET